MSRVYSPRWRVYLCGSTTRGEVEMSDVYETSTSINLFLVDHKDLIFFRFPCKNEWGSKISTTISSLLHWTSSSLSTSVVRSQFSVWAPEDVVTRKRDRRDHPRYFLDVRAERGEVATVEHFRPTVCRARVRNSLYSSVVVFPLSTYPFFCPFLFHWFTSTRRPDDVK